MISAGDIDFIVDPTVANCVRLRDIFTETTVFQRLGLTLDSELLEHPVSQTGRRSAELSPVEVDALAGNLRLAEHSAWVDILAWVCRRRGIRSSAYVSGRKLTVARL